MSAPQRKPQFTTISFGGRRRLLLSIGADRTPQYLIDYIPQLISRFATKIYQNNPKIYKIDNEKKSPTISSPTAKRRLRHRFKNCDRTADHRSKSESITGIFQQNFANIPKQSKIRSILTLSIVFFTVSEKDWMPFEDSNHRSKVLQSQTTIISRMMFKSTRLR